MQSASLQNPSEVHAKKSGLLNFSVPSPEGEPQPYARFRVCRGFIDDLNRMLPIRVRIQLEADICAGLCAGEIRGPQGFYRWDFTAG